MMSSKRNWTPATILVISVIAALINLFFEDNVFKQIFTPIYLLTCPGLTYVRYMKINDKVSEFALGIAISFIISSFVAMLMVYLNLWYPFWGLFLIIFITFFSAGIQIIKKL